MPNESDMTTLGVYTGRGAASETHETTIQSTPDPHVNGRADPGAPPAATEPPPPVSPVEPKADTDLVADLSREFAKNIGEVAATAEASKEPELKIDPSKTEPPPADQKQESWRDTPVPTGASKKVAETWASFKSKAQADIEARDSRIKQLEADLASKANAQPQFQAQLDDLKKQLEQSHGVVERVAIERSPLFKTKVTDQENLLKARLAKVLDGTGINASDAAHLLTGDLNTRENIVEPRNLSGFRKQQIADILSKWDNVAEERDRMLSRGRETLQEYVREQQTAAETQKAQFMREASQTFEDQLALIGPKLEVYNHMDGNEAWNNNVNALKASARRIFDGQVDRATLAQAAILAPAAVAFQHLLRLAQKRIGDLEVQNSKLRGVSPEVRDTGGDVAQPGRILASANGDFVKDLVDKFSKSTGVT